MLGSSSPLSELYKSADYDMVQHLIMSGIPVITALSLKTDPDQQSDHELSYHSYHGLV